MIAGDVEPADGPACAFTGRRGRGAARTCHPPEDLRRARVPRRRRMGTRARRGDALPSITSRSCAGCCSRCSRASRSARFAGWWVHAARARRPDRARTVKTTVVMSPFEAFNERPTRRAHRADDRAAVRAVAHLVVPVLPGLRAESASTCRLAHVVHPVRDRRGRRNITSAAVIHAAAVPHAGHGVADPPSLLLDLFCQHGARGGVPMQLPLVTMLLTAIGPRDADVPAAAAARRDRGSSSRHRGDHAPGDVVSAGRDGRADGAALLPEASDCRSSSRSARSKPKRRKPPNLNEGTSSHD